MTYYPEPDSHIGRDVTDQGYHDVATGTSMTRTCLRFCCDVLLVPD